MITYAFFLAQGFGVALSQMTNEEEMLNASLTSVSAATMQLQNMEDEIEVEVCLFELPVCLPVCPHLSLTPVVSF